MTFFVKYLFISLFFLITGLVLLIYMDLPGLSILIYAFSTLSVLGLTYILYRKSLKEPLIKLSGISRNISDVRNLDKSNNYEEKILSLEQILKELTEMKPNISDANLNTLTGNLTEVIKEFIAELSTAKTFKINRNEFLGNVSHELRTPIFAIQLSLETLIDGAIKDDSVNMDFLRKALSHTNRLSELSSDLISISRFETGVKLSKRYIEINSIIGEVINSLRDIASTKDLSIDFSQKVKDSERVFCDADTMKQVLTNLIDNSIKYTPPGGVITVSTMPAEKAVEISISDSGMGIPENDLPRIFERFYRVEKNRSREMGGSGLGLSIVKHILELHNTKIKVESKIGEGTRFYFTLPL